MQVIEQPVKRAAGAIEEFYQLVMQGVEAWIKAGKLVAEKLEEEPEFAEQVNAKHPEISVDMVLAFDRIGRGVLHPRLVMDDRPGLVRLRTLPYALQEKYLSQPVDVLVPNGSKWDTLKVAVHNLTAKQAAQVFAQREVRTPAAQRAYLEDRAAVGQSVNGDDAWRVVGKNLVVMKPTKLTARQLAQFLCEMEK